MRRRFWIAMVGALGSMMMLVGPTLACGGLIGPNGAVNLLRTTTLAGYHDGVEHYVTAFQFAGGGGAFGSLTPLPGVPSKVEKGGDWTLQRLVRETNPAPPDVVFAVGAAAREDAGAQVLMEVTIDALDITVLKGGGPDVGKWAADHGFRLPADAPEVLDFYASRSPIFLAAVFDADAAQERGQSIGDGTPVHVTIPTTNPWVPIRILALGKEASQTVDADVYMLTDRIPALLPQVGGSSGMTLAHSAPATTSLLDDLRSDRGMEWVPESAWLSKIEISATASQLRYDLAVDASGQGTPSRWAAGLETTALNARALEQPIQLLLVVLVASAAGVFIGRRLTYRPSVAS